MLKFTIFYSSEKQFSIQFNSAHYSQQILSKKIKNFNKRKSLETDVFVSIQLSTLTSVNKTMHF